MPLTTLDTDFFFYFKSGKSSVKQVQVVCLPTMSGKWSLTSVFGFLEDDIFPTTKMFLGLILGQWGGVTALMNHGTRGHWNFYIFKGIQLSHLENIYLRITEVMHVLWWLTLFDCGKMELLSWQIMFYNYFVLLNTGFLLWLCIG